LYGVQGSVINIARKVGIGQGGIINLAWDGGKVQGGAINVAGSTEYVQGGAVNIAGNAGKAQGGVVNIAGSVEHLQGGFINIGGHVGRQIGIINIAGKSDNTPIGLINIIGNGIIDATFFVDETGRAGTTIHTGTPYLYTLIEYNLEPSFDKWSKNLQSFGYGLGTRFGTWGNHFSLDYAYLNTRNNNPFISGDGEGENLLQKIRFGGAYKLLPGIALSSGITLNALSEGFSGNNPLILEPRGGYHWHWTFGDHRVRLWPGLYAGLTVGKF
jgi:hypothetical protein